jgi:hypothetical protein
VAVGVEELLRLLDRTGRTDVHVRDQPSSSELRRARRVRRIQSLVLREDVAQGDALRVKVKLLHFGRHVSDLLHEDLVVLLVAELAGDLF